MSTHGTPPEEAVVDAALSDPLGAEVLLGALAQATTRPVGMASIADLARKRGWPSERLDRIVAALRSANVLQVEGNTCDLLVPADDARRYAAVLRGAAYANHRHRDANTVDITLSPPASPSRLMEMLPKTDFSWARLYETKDSLIELASRATRRFVVVSPFLDTDGVDWIATLFDAARRSAERILIVRGRDEAELAMMRERQALLAAWNARIVAYAVQHDRSVRRPIVETFHAKILLADRAHAYLGSANMTRWSRDVSMECGAIISGPAVRPIATLVDAMLAIAEPLRI